MKTCNVEGCEKPYDARGWCDSHYHYRWSRDNGSAEPDYPLAVAIDGIRMRPVSLRFNSRPLAPSARP